ncbi:hypothetical protein Mettu_3736 [Methylobacter tundripaludum SV96]|uniref:Uncharacterized protein n=1 Tax=Methylobacter tundripaludum (strain ATCC BAA-1195 / DSM 17260 / SV96) TaxID=697282 RepID=G3J068_METTV|nr:hypothetical protein Mettu_3736 [Methylobacter tundripaludum SV96]
MLCVVTRSGTLQRPEPQSGYPRSHAPRGNAVPDALRPVYGVARLDRIPTQSVGTISLYFRKLLPTLSLLGCR